MTDPPIAAPQSVQSRKEPTPIPASQRSRFATSPGQLEIWFSAEAGPDASCAYNEAYSLRLKGPLNENAIVQALAQLADFHCVLRGHFEPDEKDFVIEPSLQISVACHDLSTQPASEREDAIAQVINSTSQVPYDLRRGPLYRPSYIRLSPTECVIVLGLHQMVCDDWSIEVLFADLTRLYAAQLGLQPFPAPPQFCCADYLLHCNTAEYLQKREASRSYWRTRFKTLPTYLELPYDGRRPKQRSYAAHHVTHPAAGTLRERVEAFSRMQGLDSTAVLLAAFGALLHRVSGATDLVVGVPVSGQSSAGMTGCVGQFTNLAPVRLAFPPEQTFLDLCRVTHGALRDAHEHATTGFSQLIADLNAQRVAARIPLVSVIFSHTLRPNLANFRFGDCSVEYEPMARSFEIFEFNLNVIESSAGLLLSAHVNADLYSRTWARRRLDELERLLSDGCQDPTKSVGNLTLLNYEQFGRLCQFSNNFGHDYPRDKIVSDLFESQVAQSPDAIAVRHGDRAIGYLALDQRANQLAHTLRQRGVGRGKIVGICANRGIDMVATVLAILKAGAAYLPLDPAFPADRLRYMIEDSGLCLVVSESSLANCHTCPPELTLNIDEQLSHIAEQATDCVIRNGESAQSEDFAYLIYTSGSTGRPKGVCIHHGAAVNLLTSMRSRPGLSSQDRLLAVTTLSFDIAFLELLLPLTVGGEVVLASRDDAVDGRRLLHLLQTSNATVMQATPASWRMLLEAGWQGHANFKALCGGEPLPSDLAEALLSRVGQLWNMYGPTETTVWSTCCQILDARRGLTVGKPINNTSIWVLDAQLQPCPIGVPGEIHIGGDGVASGYFNRPELTRERFIANRYGISESRLYKTGDTGRWRESGDLECLGRTDSQVKLRGFRIELGEIEAALSHVPGVKKAAVAARGQADQMQLVAYLVVDRHYEGDASARESLKRKLPYYMVPASILHLSDFPLTPNGKLDRNALPEPNAVAPSQEALEPPKDALEAQLLDLWQLELGRSPIGVTSNFFELGGHSLLAVRIFNAIFDKHQLRLHIATLIEYPTVRQLARRIGELTSSNREAGETVWSTVVPMQTRGEYPPLFCVAGLGGNPLNLRFLAKALGMNQPFYGLQHRGVDGVLPPHRTMKAMAEEFLEDLRNIQPHGPYHLAGYSTGGVAAYELARLLVERGESVDAVILLDSYNPTCLTWPLKARIKAHVDRVRRDGFRYLWLRSRAWIMDCTRKVQQTIQAQLARDNGYEHRYDAVVEATLEAELSYVTQPIAADIFLVQTDFPIPEHDGIGYPPHKSNGWQDIDHGNLKTVLVQCNHEDLVHERVAPTTGTIVRHILRTVQAKRAQEEPPPPSIMPDWLKSGLIPYYVPKGVARQSVPPKP